MTNREDDMPLETPSQFTTVIQEHLELRRRNAALEHEMPLRKYLPDDPFENHPLFKTEEQARVEDTMDGLPSIVDEPSGLEWPAEDTVAGGEVPEALPSAEEASDESLWTRSRDFDWGD